MASPSRRRPGVPRPGQPSGVPLWSRAGLTGSRAQGRTPPHDLLAAAPASHGLLLAVLVFPGAEGRVRGPERDGVGLAC